MSKLVSADIKLGVRVAYITMKLRIALQMSIIKVNVSLAKIEIKLMKGKALRKHSLHEKTAASVLLKLFISGNE